MRMRVRVPHVTNAAVVVCCLLGGIRPAAAADQVIFIVRHAERADAPGAQPPAGMMANDPQLSEAGHQRARKLAAMLASADVKHIFTTQFLRTRQTGAPLAEVNRITPVATVANDPGDLLRQVRAAAGNVLVVGHSNTVPELLKRLGVSTSISIAETEYDNLFIVVRPADGQPTLVRLRY